MNALFTALSTVGRWKTADFLRKTAVADRVQARFLRSLLQHHQDTAFGQEFGFNHIHSLDDYRQRVPVSPYRSFEPYIERIAQGEPGVLVADDVIFMNMTSGSTGSKKLIPVTRRSRRAITKATQTAIGFLAAAAHEHRRPLGKMLYAGSAKASGQTAGGIPYGPVSTSDLRMSNSLYRQVFAYPFEALQVPNMQDRTYVCLLFALAVPDLRIISATFPMLALRLAQDLDTHAEELIQDLASGELSQRLKLDPQLRSHLEHGLKPQPARAQKLQSAWQQAGGRLTPAIAWPHLSFLITARGGTSDLYFQRFPDFFGETPVFGGVYASAEATYGVHRAFNTDSVILALESGFYEFIPEDQWEVDQPQTVLPWEVRVGDRYRMVVTNYSGFYRYDMGDVVEIEGFTDKAPRFIFRHRYGGMISASTEKTTEYHVTQVMQELQSQFGIKLENFCVTLSEDLIRPHYWVNIELAPGYSLDNPEAFIQQFDAVLQRVHDSYSVKRQDQVPSPCLRLLQSGSFEQLRQRMVQQGVVEGQLKIPLVSENRDYLSGLTADLEVAP